MRTAYAIFGTCGVVGLACFAVGGGAMFGVFAAVHLLAAYRCRCELAAR